jgi:hypothetical protein
MIWLVDCIKVMLAEMDGSVGIDIVDASTSDGDMNDAALLVPSTL